jgi:hypothetical protein
MQDPLVAGRNGSGVVLTLVVGRATRGKVVVVAAGLLLALLGLFALVRRCTLAVLLLGGSALASLNWTRRILFFFYRHSGGSASCSALRQ